MSENKIIWAVIFVSVFLVGCDTYAQSDYLILNTAGGSGSGGGVVNNYYINQTNNVTNNFTNNITNNFTVQASDYSILLEAQYNLTNKSGLVNSHTLACQNLTGAASNLCTLTDTDTDDQTCAEVSGCVENAILSSYSGFTNLQSNITSVNNSKIDGTYSGFTNLQTNITLANDRITNLNSTKATSGYVDCTTNQVLKNVTANATGVFGTCVADQTGTASGGDGTGGWTNTTTYTTTSLFANITGGLHVNGNGTNTSYLTVRGIVSPSTPGCMMGLASNGTSFCRGQIHRTGFKTISTIATTITLFSFNLTPASTFDVYCDLLASSGATTTGTRLNWTANPAPVRVNLSIDNAAATAGGSASGTTGGGAGFATLDVLSTTVATPTLVMGLIQTNAAATTQINITFGAEVAAATSIGDGSMCQLVRTDI